MFPRPPAVVKCLHCASCYWLADAEELGQIDRWTESEEQTASPWTDAKAVQEPTEEEYYDAIASDLAKDKNQEKSLRVLAWWRSNDVARGADLLLTNARADESGRRRANLLRLAELFDESNDSDLLMKSEVYRELAMWPESLKLLDRVGNPQYTAVLAQIRSLCEQRNDRLHELKFESPPARQTQSTRLPTPTTAEMKVRLKDETIRRLWTHIENDGGTCTHCGISGKAETDFRLSTGLRDFIICRHCGWPQQT